MSKNKGGRGMMAVTVTMIIFFMWALWVSVSQQDHRRRHGRNYYEGDYGEGGTASDLKEMEEIVIGNGGSSSNKSAKLKKPKQGVIYDLNKNSNKFRIEGFRYYRKNPLRDKRLKKAESVWLFANKQGESAHGSITLRDLQKVFIRNKQQHGPRNKSKLKDVILVVKYHLHWAGISVTVIGTDIPVREQIVEILPVHDDEHFCTAIVNLGQVNQVTLDVDAKNEKTHFIIDELQVGVGSEIFDDLEEVTCR